MPGTIERSDLKRKRPSTKVVAKKRARSGSNEEARPEEIDAQAKILLLEDEVVASKKNYNNITTLIQLSQNSEGEFENAITASVALCRVFIRLTASGSLARKKGQSEKEIIIVQWLKDRFSEYKDVLLSLLRLESSALTALTLCMRIIKVDGQNLYDDKVGAVFPTMFLQSIVRALVESGSEECRKEFIEKFADEFDDIRFYTLAALR
jgi:U3 small nucleolar RNA-associated protein 19